MLTAAVMLITPGFEPRQNDPLGPFDKKYLNLKIIRAFLFSQSQRFQGMKNITTMRHFEKEGNILTLKDTMHYAPCDIPTVLMGSHMRLPFTWLFLKNSDEAEANGYVLEQVSNLSSNEFDNLLKR